MANFVEQTAADLLSRVDTLGNDLKSGVDNAASNLARALDTPFRVVGFRESPGDVIAPAAKAVTEVVERSATRFLKNPLRIAQGVGQAIDVFSQASQR